MNILQRILSAISTLALIVIAAVLIHLTFMVLPGISNQLTYLATMRECSTRKLAAMSAIHEGAIQVEATASAEQRAQLDEALNQTYDSFNTPDFYRECGDMVRNDWSIH